VVEVELRSVPDMVSSLDVGLSPCFSFQAFDHTGTKEGENGLPR
jgi:hypothetical protein